MPTKIPDKNLFLSKLLTSDVKRSKIVAIAFTSNGRIICSATNQCCLGHKYKWTIHAEENLIRKLRRINARKRCGDIQILVARWTPTMGWANAKPCYHCQRAIDRYGATVYYTGINGEVLKSS